MRDHEYTVGETVFVIEHSGKPSHRTKVTEVKDLKRGPKVTCEDGRVWDVDAHCIWGQRSIQYNMGPHLAPHSDKREAQYRALVSKSFLNWALHNFDDLTAEHQESIRDAIIQVKRERKNKEQT